MAKLFRYNFIKILSDKNLIFHEINREFHSCTSLNAVFPAFFKKPVFKPEQIKDLEKSGELSKISHVPILPAKVYDTSSVFYNDLIEKVTNHILKKGKRELARNLLQESFEIIKRQQVKKYNSLTPEEQAKTVIKHPAALLASALENCKPILVLTPIKRGGVRYQVPVPVRPERSFFLAIEWLLEAAREKERTVHFPEKFAAEILDAASNKGRVVKKKQDLHRQCESNRAYAHYRWS